MSKFNYGNFHLKYDMSGEIKIGTGTIKAHSVFDGTPEFLKQADCVFTDPPCNKGNLKSFYTKAEIELNESYEKFNEALFSVIDAINPKHLFIEVFKSNKEIIENLVKARYSNVSITQSYYYYDKSKVCWIIQATNENLYEIPYLDEQYVIEHICNDVNFDCIADPCMGRGLVGFYANKANKRFVGTELNEKRLAVLIERINKGKL
jgi:DNA modification methylase